MSPIFDANLPLVLANWYEIPLMILFILVSFMLILIVLIQRPKGGGLSGAFGGGGGSASSAFGADSGKVLTYVTVGFFIAFLLLAMSLTFATRPDTVDDTSGTVSNAPAGTGASAPVPPDGDGSDTAGLPEPPDGDGSDTAGLPEPPVSSDTGIESATGIEFQLPETSDGADGPGELKLVAPELPLNIDVPAIDTNTDTPTAPSTDPPTDTSPADTSSETETLVP